jgi:hypothetical protein
MMKDVVFDYESEGIEAPPDYPPKPVGLAIMIDGKPLFEGGSYYNAWGHPTENNCQEAKVRLAVLDLIVDEETHWTAHNLAFDAAIMETHWGIIFPYDRATDTMLQAFLANPYGQLSLKPLCEQDPLKMPPVERDAVRDWLVANGICRAGSKEWGAHISKAPGALVGRYAHGDIIRAKALRNYFRALAPTPLVDPEKQELERLRYESFLASWGANPDRMGS